MPRFVLLRLAYSVTGPYGVGVWSAEENKERAYHYAFSCTPPVNIPQVGYWTYITALLHLRGEARKREVWVRAKFPEPSLPNQLNGAWRVRGELVRPLWESAKELEKQFAGVEHLYDPLDTSEVRALLRERVKGGRRFVFPDNKREVMEGKIVEVMKALEPFNAEEACFLLRSILSVYEPEGFRINKHDLIHLGQKMVLKAHMRLREGGEACKEDRGSCDGSCENCKGDCRDEGNRGEVCRCRRVPDYEYA